MSSPRLIFTLLKKILLFFLLLIFTLTSIYVKESFNIETKSRSFLNLNLIKQKRNWDNQILKSSRTLQSLDNLEPRQNKLKKKPFEVLSFLSYTNQNKTNVSFTTQNKNQSSTSIFKSTTTPITILISQMNSSFFEPKSTASTPIIETTTVKMRIQNKTKGSSKKTKTIISIIKSSRIKECIPPAYKEFPPDIFGHSARVHGFIIIHILVVLYMFYCLAVVCDHYFLTSLEECAKRLNLSHDVAGATFMAAGSSAPELFTAMLGVFVAKGDVGTGTIVGSAVFNILFVIGLCGVLTTSTMLNWWSITRDSTCYIFSVFVLILCVFDGEVSTFESSFMLVLYIVYIIIMHFNLQIREIVIFLINRYASKSIQELDTVKAKNQPLQYHYMRDDGKMLSNSKDNRYLFYKAANRVIIKHKRLFPAISRFRAAANLVIIQNQQYKFSHQKVINENFLKEKNFESFSGPTLMAKKRIDQSPDIEHWRNIPNPVIEGWTPVIQWCVVAPVHAILFYTIPNCKIKESYFLLTFVMSVFWIAVFSYVMVWMVTLIGFTYGIPDTIMGITFLAAGTSIPDAYASIHVAKMGQANMAVSNSFGSNIFDILIGLALPWFIETTIVHRGKKATINSGGLLYAILLLFLCLIATIYMFHKNAWTLNPKLGTALLITYAVFLILCSVVEMNLFGYVNPVMCEE